MSRLANKHGSPAAIREFMTVSMHKSLKKPRGIVRLRNVLTRGERIDQLLEEGRWNEGQSPLGLPKVLVKRAVAGKKQKQKED